MAPPVVNLVFSLASSGEGGSRRQRAADHDVICSVNLLTASMAAGAVFELTSRGLSGIAFSLEDAGGVGRGALTTLGAFAWQSVLEYYWHRMMHLPAFYRRFHKMHHHYKSPQPFDDMYIHPLEAVGYYMILYSPAFIFCLHWSGFAAYMTVMGMCGVIDHCGIEVSMDCGCLGCLVARSFSIRQQTCLFHPRHPNCKIQIPTSPWMITAPWHARYDSMSHATCQHRSDSLILHAFWCRWACGGSTTQPTTICTTNTLTATMPSPLLRSTCCTARLLAPCMAGVIPFHRGPTRITRAEAHHAALHETDRPLPSRAQSHEVHHATAHPWLFPDP